jgi:hypothetical protein
MLNRSHMATLVERHSRFAMLTTLRGKTAGCSCAGSASHLTRSAWQCSRQSSGVGEWPLP